jgi:hypothetical protein
MVLSPSLDKRFKSFILPIPFTSETKIKGMAINFSSFIKIVPQGFIHSVTISECPVLKKKKPATTPKSIPASISAKMGIFFIVISSYKDLVMSYKAYYQRVSLKQCIINYIQIQT